MERDGKFGIDVMLPGMAYGKIVMPPVRFGATVKSVDAVEARYDHVQGTAGNGSQA